MAYYNDEEDEQLDPNAPQQTAPGSQLLGAGGTAGPATDEQAAAVEPASASGAAGGTTGGQGNFAGINDYINANKSQSSKLAGQVSGYVGGLGDQARGQLTEQQGKYNQVVDQNTVNLNQGLLDQAKQNAVQVASNQQSLGDFQKMRDASYTGPQSFEGSDFYQPAAKSVETAQTAAGQTATEEGQRTLLARLQQQQRGRVNTGATTFDQALLQADPEARAQLQAARDKQSDLATILNNAKAAGLTKAQQAAQTSAATRQAVQSQFTGDQSPQAQMQRAIQDRVANLQGVAQQNKTQLLNDINQGRDLTDYQLGLLGVSRDQWGQLAQQRQALQGYGVDPLQNIVNEIRGRGDSGLITAQNAANQEEYAKWAALNQLMGTQNSFLSDPSQAGRYDIDDVDFNFGGANDYLGTTLAGKRAEEARAKAQAEAAARDAEIRAAEKKAQKALETSVVDSLITGTPFLPRQYLPKDLQPYVLPFDPTWQRTIVTDPLEALDQAVAAKNQIGNQAIGAIDSVTGGAASTVNNAVKDVGGSISKGAKKIFSDERLKKDVEEFDPSKFLDDLTKTDWRK